MTDTAYSGRLRDRVAIVTGAGHGIGRNYAQRFAREGAAVVLADIDGGAAEACAQELSAEGLPAVGIRTDIREKDDVDRMAQAAVDTFGRVDVLVNNAMRISAGELDVRDDDDMADELDVNLLGAFRMVKVCLPVMQRQHGGAIVNVASVNGLGYYGNDLYSAAKAGLISLTRSVAARHGRDGIRCNAVAPGTIATPVWRERAEREPGFWDRVSRYYPLGRVGRPEDVAEAIAFLSSAQASWITGVTLPVDGGLLTGNLAMADELTAAD